jgi:hypothetical protein
MKFFKASRPYYILNTLLASKGFRINSQGSSWQLPTFVSTTELDSSEPLRFAYSCAYLMLARTLQHMNHTESDKSSNPKVAFEASALPFIECSIYHSIRILNLFLSMSELTTYIHPAYKNLLLRNGDISRVCHSYS